MIVAKPEDVINIKTVNELEKSTVTWKIPHNCDGTVSIKIRSGKVHVKFNTKFIETYEDKLYECG